MGKTKQAKENKKFDRNVEISAPILDPELIKAIHSPPKGQRLDIRHGGFKALLSDLNSQDSIDELTPLNDNHVPSYIGISCAVSGYSNYSSYSKRESPTKETLASANTSFNSVLAQNRSRTTSPTGRKIEPQVRHITIDKNNIHSVEDERKELTEKLTASATERRRSPSPCVPPTEDDRHHGAYVGARYCPLPPPDKLVNKHIPLLGIDDEKNPDEIVEDENKVEQKIASLYGENFVENWKESMTHKAKKELASDQSLVHEDRAPKSPKDLANLKPIPHLENKDEADIEVDIPTPDIKVLAGVEKKFLNKLLSDDNPPVPSQPPPQSPTSQVGSLNRIETKVSNNASNQSTASLSPVEPDLELPKSHQLTSPVQSVSSPTPEPLVSIESTKEQNTIGGVEAQESIGQPGEGHIECEIRAQSPVDNESSPVKVLGMEQSQHPKLDEQEPYDLVNPVSGTLAAVIEEEDLVQVPKALVDDVEEERELIETSASLGDKCQDGHYYLALLEKERSFICEKIEEAEGSFREREASLDEDTIGRVRSAIGKANLLINKKCNQFRELCEANINERQDELFATLNDDLAGFWDMLLIQINDVKRSFETLWDVQKDLNNSSSIAESDSNITEVSNNNNYSHSTTKHVLSAEKDQERRDRLKEHIEQMKRNQSANEENSGCYIATKNEDVLIEADVSPGLLVDDERSQSSIVNEAEEQLFSLMGTTSPLPSEEALVEQQQQIHQTMKEEISSEPTDLVDLTD